jgi:DnaJ family protein A protein 2
LVVVFTIEPHKKFERKGADLYFKKKITLFEALTECNFTIEHLDGKKINITTKPGEIVTPGSMR